MATIKEVTKLHDSVIKKFQKLKAESYNAAVVFTNKSQEGFALVVNPKHVEILLNYDSPIGVVGIGTETFGGKVSSVFVPFNRAEKKHLKDSDRIIQLAEKKLSITKWDGPSAKKLK